MTESPVQRPRVLIIVQNLPVPFDRRVWLECQTLTSSGYDVSVVCPKAPGDPSYSRIDGVELYKYRPYAPGGSHLSFAWEYAYSFLATLLLALRAASRGRFAVVQTCNPPDSFWPIGLVFRMIHGSRFVFDHHDLCPELFESRFPQGRRTIYRALRFLERQTIRSADHVISTNESYREIAMARCGVSPNRVTVVRTGPDANRLKPVKSDPRLRRGRAHLVAYIGVMAPQDGVDLILRVADIVVNEFGRGDIAFTLIGEGDCYRELNRLCAELRLSEHVEFAGRLPDEQVARILSSADLGICPDPKNPLNDVSTMNKTLEYMAFGLPIVAFDLRETRISAGRAAVYATPNRVAEFARLLVELVDDESRRRAMGAEGRVRVERELAWVHQAQRYLDVYSRISNGHVRTADLAAARA